MKKSLLLLLCFTIAAQVFSQTKEGAFLKRYTPEKQKFISIPLTQFLFVDHSEVKPGTSSWIVDWCLRASNKNNLLFIEMNCTDVENWLGDGDISGSMQLVVTIPNFFDSTTVVFTSPDQRGLYFVNNITHDAKTSFGAKSSIKLKRTKTGLQITGDIYLTSINPDTDQRVDFNNQGIKEFSLSQFHAYTKKLDKKREAEQNAIVEDLVDAIKVRDSIDDIRSKKYEDSIKAHPYMGPLRFWVSSLNKAGYSRTTYYVTRDSIEVKTGPYDFIYFAKNYSADKVQFINKMEDSSVSDLKELADTISAAGLKSMYSNTCVMDGLILVFQFEWEGKVVTTSISNYYQPRIVPVIAFLNKIVPEKYKIWYDKAILKKMMEGCKLLLD